MFRRKMSLCFREQRTDSKVGGVTEHEILQIFRESGALLDGHFVLRSGLHSRQYFQCALALQQMPIVGKYFDIGPWPMSGSSTTVKQTTRRLGPSMRMAADLSDWDNSLLNVVTGQSGQILSSHYRDEWGHYYAGQSYPMQFGKVDGKAVLRLTPKN